MPGAIHGSWETHEAMVTDGEGRIAFTGFKGSYALEANGRKAVFALNGPVCEELILG